MYKIGEFSKLSQLTVRTMYHYEDLGMLMSQKIDTNTKYRYYSVNQLETSNQIKVLQEIGLSLREIKFVI